MSSDPFSALAEILPDAFSKTMLAGAVAALQADNPLRAHHFATSIRELIGYLLHKLGPDEQVVTAPWYKKEEDRPTRRQRATFAIQGGMSDALVESLGIDISEMQKQLSDAIGELNKHTHVREDTLLQDAAQIEEFAIGAGTAVLSFLTTIEELHTAVAESAVHTLGSGIFEKFIETTVDDLDILSTHTQVEGIQVDNVEVGTIGLDTISYAVEGTVYVQLVWGSGSDFDRGDGATHSDSFPFTCGVVGSVETLTAFSGVSNLNVDTSSWYED